MKKIILLFLPLLFVIVSCESYDEKYGIHDEYVHITDKTTIQLSALANDSKTANFEATGKWRIEPASDAFFSVDPLNGEGNGKITITSNEDNTTESERSSSFIIICDKEPLKCTVIQNGGKKPSIKYRDFANDTLFFEVDTQTGLDSAGIKVSNDNDINKSNSIIATIQNPTVTGDDKKYSCEAYIPNLKLNKDTNTIVAWANNKVGRTEKEIKKLSSNITIKNFEQVSNAFSYTFQVESDLNKEKVCLYYTNDGSEPKNDSVSAIESNGIYQATISDFLHDKKYLVKAYAKNAFSESFSKQKELYTKIDLNIEREKGTSKFIITPLNPVLDIDTVGFCYTTDKEEPTISNNHIEDVLSNNVFQESIKKLDKYKVYVVRAFARYKGAKKGDYSYSETITSFNTEITFDTEKSEDENQLEVTIKIKCESDLEISKRGVSYSSSKNDIDSLNTDSLTDVDADNNIVKIEKISEELYAKAYAENASGRYYSAETFTIPVSKTPGSDDNPLPGIHQTRKK